MQPVSRPPTGIPQQGYCEARKIAPLTGLLYPAAENSSHFRSSRSVGKSLPFPLARVAVSPDSVMLVAGSPLVNDDAAASADETPIVFRKSRRENSIVYSSLGTCVFRIAQELSKEDPSRNRTSS